MRIWIAVTFAVLVAGFNAQAQDARTVRLAVPDVLVESGLMKFMLPRFSLKTQVRVKVVAPGQVAEAALGQKGTPVFEGDGGTWSLAVLAPDHPGTGKFFDWITSEVGQRAITGYTRDGTQVFSLPTRKVVAVEQVTIDGDASLGQKLSRLHCGRCHVTRAADRMLGIGSTPSFFVLRAMEDWEYRFSAFYALNPHPSFTQIDEITPPFPDDRPSPIYPVELTLEEVEAILAYVSAIEPADLGAPLKTQ